MLIKLQLSGFLILHPKGPGLRHTWAKQSQPGGIHLVLGLCSSIPIPIPLGAAGRGW